MTETFTKATLGDIQNAIAPESGLKMREVYETSSPTTQPKTRCGSAEVMRVHLMVRPTHGEQAPNRASSFGLGTKTAQ
jgi:hypothetical protein